MLKKIILLIGCLCAFLLLGCEHEDEPATEDGLVQDSDYVYSSEEDTSAVDYATEATEEAETTVTTTATEATVATEVTEQSDNTSSITQLPTDNDTAGDHNADHDFVDNSNNARYWIVRSGDTLFSISRVAVSTVAEIQRQNNMGDSTDIIVGQKIYLPPSPALPNLTIRWLSWENATRPEGVPIFYWSDTEGATLLFEPNEVMRDFELFRVDYPYGDSLRRAVGEVIHQAGTLDANNHLVIDNFWFSGGAGLLNVNSGFSFVNDQGVRRFFVFGENTAYPDHGSSPVAIAEFLN